MIWDWHTGIVLSSVVHPALVAVFLLHFFENKERLYCTSDMNNALIWKINSDTETKGEIKIMKEKSYKHLSNYKRSILEQKSQTNLKQNLINYFSNQL
jgi:hypothetical protein